MKSVLRILTTAVCTFLTVTGVIAVSFFFFATRGETYYRIQTDLGVDAGIDGATMRELDTLLAEYLRGDVHALDATELFGADEKAHMVDVYNIFAVMKTAGLAALAVGAMSWLITSRRLALSPLERRAGRISGVLMLLAPLSCVAIWAAVDFSAAFTWMHELLFTNDLWLMDPRRQLMIRMLPEDFFVRLGASVALKSVLTPLLLWALVYVFRMLVKHKKDRRQHIKG